MALKFDHVRCQIDDIELVLNLSLTDGAIVGITGPDPGEIQMLVDVASGAVPVNDGLVERDSVFVAGPTFHSGDPEAVAWWVEAALQSEARILAIGPALALAAPGFRIAAMRELQRTARDGRLVLLASQDLELLERGADEVIVIEEGEVVGRGDPRQTIAAYRERIARELREASDAAGEAEPARHGDQRARIVSFELLGEDGEPATSLQTGEQATVAVKLQFDEDVENPVFGVLIRTGLASLSMARILSSRGCTSGPGEAGRDRGVALHLRLRAVSAGVHVDDREPRLRRHGSRLAGRGSAVHRNRLAVHRRRRELEGDGQH